MPPGVITTQRTPDIHTHRPILAWPDLVAGACGRPQTVFVRDEDVRDEDVMGGAVRGEDEMGGVVRGGDVKGEVVDKRGMPVTGVGRVDVEPLGACRRRGEGPVTWRAVSSSPSSTSPSAQDLWEGHRTIAIVIHTITSV